MKYIRSYAGGVALLPSPGGLSDAPSGVISGPRCVLSVTNTSNGIVLACSCGPRRGAACTALPSCRPPQGTIRGRCCHISQGSYHFVSFFLVEEQ